ncbi:CAP domain-containing protein [Nicoliella lavandulae]|uniref:CAP domain-containing protein n=1 Tax=Nicoliella lavandulae TaxID=3082954 RepID=A0ABU8SNZ7_9LACO
MKKTAMYTLICSSILSIGLLQNPVTTQASSHKIQRVYHFYKKHHKYKIKKVTKVRYSGKLKSSKKLTYKGTKYYYVKKLKGYVKANSIKKHKKYKKHTKIKKITSSNNSKLNQSSNYVPSSVSANSDNYSSYVGTPSSVASEYGYSNSSLHSSYSSESNNNTSVSSSTSNSSASSTTNNANVAVNTSSTQVNTVDSSAKASAAKSAADSSAKASAAKSAADSSAKASAARSAADSSAKASAAKSVADSSAKASAAKSAADSSAKASAAKSAANSSAKASAAKSAANSSAKASAAKSAANSSAKASAAKSAADSSAKASAAKSAADSSDKASAAKSAADSSAKASAAKSASDKSAASQITNNTDPSKYNDGLPQYNIGDSVAFISGDPNLVILDHFPNSETDTSGTISLGNSIRATILNKKVAPWKTYYYQIKFNNGITGWVSDGSIYKSSNPVNPKPVSQAEIGDAINNAVKYINYVRQNHNLKPLTIDPTINKFANERSQQIINDYNHRDKNNNSYYQMIARANGRDDLANQFGENITYNFSQDGSSLIQKIIQAINGMLYEDSASNWGHRDNFLSSDFTQIGIGITQTDNGTVYTSFDFH